MKTNKDKKTITIAIGMIAVLFLLQGGYYIWVLLNIKINQGPESYRRYGDMQAVDSNAPYLDSRIDIKGYSLAQVQHYFNDIALHEESGMCDDIVRKWVSPIKVYIVGTPNESDWGVMEKLFSDMNGIKGFPGISIVSTEQEANFIGYFYAEEEYKAFMTEINGYKQSNGTSFLDWDEESGIIDGGLFAVRSDLENVLRHTVILEEIVQAMGMQNDSYAYPDSLFYQEYHENTEPSELDWIVFQILYHPMIQSGMNYAQCVPVIATIIQR